ncbi:ABC transporter ATP-binding protein [Synechococcus sp. BA-124 BA4]|uniref:ABC transporter ATP-binding protein n=1 Tax=unclassified Synechococcus TaxID=2626047 RepID=UPI0018CCE04E|nr:MULTISPECIES: ABC transporter ATP-binding protein [unclassified Synechococcus]MEA5398448.1 ABC transporter ATP-binding protein [Synechococcus sp. BA-124 BA4]QPN57718.1 ABC transporter ATP-binding protein [Synechococcus sp. CBW1107]CAK6686726.1 Lipid A export ATP-binding/permease protein MsbA [Synechococcus sp. CBW1107]
MSNNKKFNSQTIGYLARLLRFLPKKRYKALLILAPLSIMPGILDLLTIAVVSRLAGALIGIKLLDFIPGVKVFGGSMAEQSLWLISIFIALAWSASALRLILQYTQQRLTALIWRDFSDQIHHNILYQPYSYHLLRSTSGLTSLIIGNVKAVSNGVINPILRIASSSVSIVLLSFGIVFVGRWLSVIMITLLVIAYLGLSLFLTPYLRHASKQVVREDARSTHALMESLASIRDIQLANAEPFFQNSFVASGERAQRYAWISALIPIIPRQLIEPLGITMIFLFGAVPYLANGNIEDIRKIIPLLAGLAIAAQKLTPPLQDLFSSITLLRGSLPKIAKTVELLELSKPRLTLIDVGVPSPESVFPRHSIRLKNAWYRYPRTENFVVRGVNLSIPVGSRVALVGATGSGKSTVAHLLLGLLDPDIGSFELDGIPLDETTKPAWQACCAQVPQHIQLLDASVQSNVAFGIDPERIDFSRLWEALQAAQLADVVAELPYGLLTPIGENGMKLSGGQRQRLALARSFYRNSKFLLLDEATSSLDNRTESDVINAFEMIGRRCTTVVIAHRLSTIVRCDRIYELHNGLIKASGTYEELRDNSDSFRDLSKLEIG